MQSTKLCIIVESTPFTKQNLNGMFNVYSSFTLKTVTSLASAILQYRKVAVKTAYVKSFRNCLNAYYNISNYIRNLENV